MSIEPGKLGSLSREPGVAHAPLRDHNSATRIVIAVGLILVSIWIASEAWGEIASLLWFDEQSSHGLIVPLATFMLVAARRARLSEVQINSHWAGPLITLIGVALWACSWHLDFQSGWHGGALLMAIGCWVTLTGVDPIRKFAPAYVVLIFLLPTPAALRTPITIPLQDITATLTQHFAELVGMGVTQAGRTLRVNGQDVTVAEACSGMRMVFTLFLACFISVYSLPLREWIRWLVLLCTPLIAIVANLFRLIPTLWAYGRFDAVTADHIHTVSGWIMVVAAFLVVEAMLKSLNWYGLPILKVRDTGRRAAA